MPANLFRRALRRLRRQIAALRPGPVILMYHRIAEVEGDPWDICVSPANFASQLKVLKSSRQVLSLTDFCRRHAEGSLPPNAAAITFDDGYACNAAVAAPLLIENGLPATIFLCSGMIGSTRWFWWDALEEIVMQHRDVAIRITSPERREWALGARDSDLQRRSWRASGGEWTARQRAYIGIWTYLKSLDNTDRESAMAELHAQSGVPEQAPASGAALSLQQLNWLAGQPLIELGAHTVTHPALAGCAPAVQGQEIGGSVEECARLIGRNIRSFAYPYGSYGPETPAIAAEAGLEFACTTRGDRVKPGDPLLELPRYQVFNLAGKEMLKTFPG